MSGPTSAWYADFFTELPNALWRAAIPPAATAAEVDFLEWLGVPPGGRVLDVPCGSGRRALELARRGFRARGVDISAEAIDVAQRLAAAENLPVDLRVGDMAHLDPAGPVDAVVCMGNAFGYLPHEQTLSFVRTVRESLSPTGLS